MTNVETRNSVRPGYTLPVFACAAAIAALRQLNTPSPISGRDAMAVPVYLITPDETVDIPIEQCAPLNQTSALAMTRSDPGDNLDLTRHTPIWARVVQREISSDQSSAEADPIRIMGGEGIGVLANRNGQPAIYRYAIQLLMENLSKWLCPHQAIDVTIILPEGRSLAQRTSNEAFGVVDGLSLLGTSGIAHPLSAPDQLEIFRNDLRQKSQDKDTLVFCIGENGLHLAQTLGIPPEYRIKTANWIGPLLVEAGLLGIRSLLLFGYHGKLVKLAGGIFHTHHYVADGRQEIFASACMRVGLAVSDIQHILDCKTLEDGLTYLRGIDQTTGTTWVDAVYGHVLKSIEGRSQTYIHVHSQAQVQVGTLVFDRQRTVIQTSPQGRTILQRIC